MNPVSPPPPSSYFPRKYDDRKRPNLTVAQARAHASAKVEPWGKQVAEISHHATTPPAAPSPPTRPSLSRSQTHSPVSYSRSKSKCDCRTRPAITPRSSSDGPTPSFTTAFTSPPFIRDDESELAPEDAVDELPRRRKSIAKGKGKNELPAWLSGGGTPFIPDPDYPDGPPPCLSPYYFVRGHEGSCSLALRPPQGKLTVSELGRFGYVGKIEDVWGPPTRELGLCTCTEKKLHGDTCPLHIQINARDARKAHSVA